MEGGAPKGRRLDGDGGMKKSEEMHLKYAINESTLSTANAVPLPQWGRGTGVECPITICGEAAATTHNPQPTTLNPEPLNPYTYQPL